MQVMKLKVTMLFRLDMHVHNKSMSVNDKSMCVNDKGGKNVDTGVVFWGYN